MVAEANYIKAQGIKTVALLRDDTPFADELVPDFVAAAKADHIKIASQQTYPATAVNVTTEVSQLKATGAGTLVLIAQVGIGTVYSGLSSVNWAPNVVGTAVDYFEGYTSLGNLSNKSYANCGVAVKKGQNLDASTLKLVNLVVAKTGSQPDYASTIVNVNDDLLILKYAITKAKSVSGPSVASAVETIRNKSFTSPDYKYTFTKSNHAGYPAASAHTCLLSPLGQDGTPIIAAP
jgi:branched-chain amino acid transport system substrate-binding protein